MGVIRVSPRLYKIILEDAARDGVSLTYAADRIFDSLLEAQGRFAKVDAENSRLKTELNKKPKTQIEEKTIEVPAAVSKKLLRIKLAGKWGGELTDTMFLHNLYESLREGGIVLKD